MRRRNTSGAKETAAAVTMAATAPSASAVAGTEVDGAWVPDKTFWELDKEVLGAMST